MGKIWAAPLAAISVVVSNGTFAQEILPASRADSASSKAVRLSDAELDEITAGTFVTVVVFNPGNADILAQNEHRTLLVQGTGTPGNFGFVIVVKNNGDVVSHFHFSGPH
jgi:hypothetical protein